MRFSEFCKFQEGYVNPSQKKSEYFNGNIKWLRATDLNNSFVNNTSRTLSEKGYKSAGKSAYLFKPGTLAISKSGTIGRLGILQDYMCGNRAVINLEVDEKLMNNLFVFYWLLNKRDYIRDLAVGSVQKNLYVSALEKLKIEYRPLNEQQSIAHILSTLDEKIETNNQINKKLEEMAQVIFKHWFVDFQFPNEDGEPYKSSGGEMVESEIGMIPKGWTLEKISEFGRIVTGKTPTTKQIENFGDKYNFITPRDIQGNMFILRSERLLSEVGADKVKSFKIKKNSIGVSCIGSNLGEVYINTEDSFTNQQINSIILFKEELYPFIYIILKNMKDDFINLAGGSAIPIINKTIFSNIIITKPDNLLLDRFVKTTGTIFETIKKRIIENNCLSNLRDTLLPKLMSGEIRVPLEEGDVS